MEERIVTKTQKARVFQVQNQDDADRFFLVSMELSMQNSCHQAKLFISTSTKNIGTSDVLSEGEKKITVGNEVMAASSLQCSSS